MIRREDCEPPRNEECIIETDDVGLIARWLSGNDSYEGWYLPEYRMIKSQKELKVKRFKRFHKSGYRVYIPKEILNTIFGSNTEVSNGFYKSCLNVLMTE